jgi:putative tryptophan/tyrosine transport system substrate-binding protein
MTVTIGRRELLAALGAGAAWPLAAHAQQPERMRRIVFLHPLAESTPIIQARIVAFRQALETLGWIENRDIRIDHRYYGGDLGRIQTYTTELVRSAPDLIVCSSAMIVAALKQATDTIPIVFSVVSDPVGQGFVASLARPGGNITGFTFVDFPLIGKWLEMLKGIAPVVKRVALVFNPQTAPFYPSYLRELGAVAASLPAEISATPVRNEAEIEPALTALERKPGGGLIVPPHPFINIHRRLIIALAERRSQPDQLSEKFLRNLRKICPVESRKIAKKIVKISVS